MYSLVVMININADKFAKTSSAPKFPKIADKTSWVPSETDNGTIDVDNKCMMTIDFGSGG